MYARRRAGIHRDGRRAIVYDCGMSDTTIRLPPPARPILQLYRGAIKGRDATEKRDVLARYCDRIVTIGLPAVCFHGFPEELANAWDGLARLAQNRGLLAAAAWGLDGKNISAKRKGELVGSVLAKPSCVAGLLDAEGQYDSDTGPADDMDEAGALTLCKAIQFAAPNAWVGDQPWYKITSHGDVRRTAKPIEQGGTFSGFPVDEFATVCNWGRFRQAYIYNDLGAYYRPTFDAMDKSWAEIAPSLRSLGLERPLRVTLQGYRWKSHEFVDALLSRGSCRGEPVVIWCDPMIAAPEERGLRFVLWCEREGFVSVGASAVDVVKAAQAALNRSGARLDVDGAAGDATLAAWETITAV